MARTTAIAATAAAPCRAGALTAEGFHQRFGAVHVDFETQHRTGRDSSAWYAS
ncbi:family 1 glycosylhydrolase [Kitasatospora sp. NBC_00374]|uniref:family 1 glycosylhydrolase n=1 Tax=Kitasatospora sp. NBC_00374 TaxID=2975964 RepID=UPI00352F5256